MQRSLLVAVLMIAVSLGTIGCGDADNVEGVDTGVTNSLMLTWSAPTTNEDGSLLDDLAGYKLYYGTQSGYYTEVIRVGAFTTAEISNLDVGTWFIAVTAYDYWGNESDFSEEISHTFY
jgi:hypothetical protein